MLILLYGQPLRPTLELFAPVFQPCIQCSKHIPFMTSKRMRQSGVDEAVAEAPQNHNCTGNIHTERRQYGSHGPEEPLKPPLLRLALINPFQSMIEAPFAAFMRSHLWRRRVRGGATRNHGNNFLRHGHLFRMFQQWACVDRNQYIRRNSITAQIRLIWGQGFQEALTNSRNRDGYE